MSIHSGIKAIIRDNDFLALAGRFQKTNIFHVTGLGNQEIRHSNFLAWLMNPSKTHGLRDAFIKSILSRLYDESLDAKKPLQDNIIELLLDDLFDSSVSRESESNIDLLFKTNDKRLVVCIENKIWASISDHQLSKYARYIEKHYSNYRNKVFVLLSPSGYDVPSSKAINADDWLPFSYISLSECLGELVSQTNDTKTRLMIEDYLDLLERNGIVKDPELQQMVDKLYNRYSDVFDLVYARKSDARKIVETELKQLYITVLEELGGEDRIASWLHFDEKVGQYIWFTTTRMNEYLPFEEGVNGTWGDGSTYCYWVYPDLLAPTIKLELGPLNHSDALIEKMEAIRNYAKPNSKTISRSDRYRRVKSISTNIDERDTISPEEIDIEKTKQLLRAAIQEMLDFEEQFFSRKS